MNNFADIFGEFIDNYHNTFGVAEPAESVIKELYYERKDKYEELLDKMYHNYMCGCTRQIVNYNKQIDDIKLAGLKVLRNSSGKHKIVMG